MAAGLRDSSGAVSELLLPRLSLPSAGAGSGEAEGTELPGRVTYPREAAVCQPDGPALSSHEPGIFLIASTEESSLQTFPVPSAGLLGVTLQRATDLGGSSRGLSCLVQKGQPGVLGEVGDPGFGDPVVCLG